MHGVKNTHARTRPHVHTPTRPLAHTSTRPYQFHVLLPDGRTIAVPVMPGSLPGSEIIVKVPPQSTPEPPQPQQRQQPVRLNERGLPSEAAVNPGMQPAGQTYSGAPPGTAGAGDKGMRRRSYGLLGTVASGLGAAAKATATAVGSVAATLGGKESGFTSGVENRVGYVLNIQRDHTLRIQRVTACNDHDKSITTDYNSLAPLTSNIPTRAHTATRYSSVCEKLSLITRSSGC